MIPHNFPSQGFRLEIILCILFISAVFSSPSPAATDPLAELHDKAKKRRKTRALCPIVGQGYECNSGGVHEEISWRHCRPHRCHPG